MFNLKIKKMKKFALTFFGLAVAAFAIAQELVVSHSPEYTSPSAGAAIFSWDATSHEFGQIKVQIPVSHEFSFTNNGDIPLVISAVQASCGCTVTSFTKDPIAPGMKGYVTATYNAAKTGQFTKTVTVMANTDENVLLTIKGEVVE